MNNFNNPYECLKSYIGQEIKYPDFCKITNLPKLTGKAKTLQLKEVQQYVDLIQQNRKIYIRAIYGASECQIIERQGKFTTYIENFLMNLLKDIPNDSVILTNREILEMLSMVNKDYFKGKFCPYYYIDKLDIGMNKADCPSEEYIFNKALEDSEIFFSSSYRLLKRIIYNSLKSMENKSLIHIEKTYRLYKNYQTPSGAFMSENHDCTPEEIQKILTIQYESIQEFNNQVPRDNQGNPIYFLKGLNYISLLYPQQRQQYFDIVNRKVCEVFKKDGYNAFSNAWKLNLADKSCFDYEIKRLNYLNLNKNVQQKLLKAKDLEIINKTIKKQFIDLFIKNNQNPIDNIKNI